MKASRLVILALLVILLLGGLPDLCSAIAGPGRRLAVRGSVAGDESEDPSDFNSDDLEDYDDEDEEDGKPKETIAQFLDEALKEEFKDEAEKQAEVGKQFNETVSREEGTQATVVIISQKKDKERAANRTAAIDEGGKTPFTAASDKDATVDGQGAATNATDTKSRLDTSVEADVDRIIDSHDNEYVLSKPNEEGSMGLTLDPQLIRDLSLLIVTAALGGLLMESLGQPTINGYFVAGSLVGPGGVQWIKEIVQVQSLAQLGVHFLLFTLGLELSLGKLRAVRDVALLGGLLQIALMAGVGGIGAAVIGVRPYHGAFVGALVAMSSTSIVVKCLQEARASHQPHAQITIGTLVLQDCVVGLLFAFMPVLASAGSNSAGISPLELLSVGWRVLLKLAVACAVAAAVAALVMPAVMRRIARFSAETFQISVLGFCLISAVATTRLGISAELGAFMAGVVLASTDHQEAVLAAAEPISHLFLALFIASTGLTIAPAFLAEHILVLAAGAAVVITVKMLLIAGVVLLFRYPADTALAVGINLAQIGEFGFVLLSIATQQGLIGSQVYLLLMGITALSLLLTPFLLQVSTRLILRGKGSGSGASDVELANLLQMSPGKESPLAKRNGSLDGARSNSLRGGGVQLQARRLSSAWQKRRGDDDLDARRSGSSSSVGTPVQGAMPNTSTSLGGHSTAHRRNGHSRTSSGEAIGMP